MINIPAMGNRKLQFRSTLSLVTAKGPIASQRWMDLLVHIGESRSISQAAKAVGLTYKAAWDAIDAMNNLAPGPLVKSSKGGQGGGGTELTTDGRRLVEAFQAVAAEHHRFVEKLDTGLGVRPAELNTMRRLTMLTSARNHFAGTVSKIIRGAVNDQIVVALPGGARIVATITHQSSKNLGLRKGVEVVALIKASWVMVAVDDEKPLKLSVRNQLRGTIKRLTPGAVNTEVVIGLPGGQSVLAIITKDAARELKLRVNRSATALFKASSVILGVAA